MSRIAPADDAVLGQLVDTVEQTMGCVPNSLRTMRRAPGLTEVLAAELGQPPLAFAQDTLGGVGWRPGGHAPQTGK